MIGKTIGKYRFVGHLGRGGMGTVYKAVDNTLDREVAIKVLNPGLAETEIIARFRNEAMTVAKLSHPEIATIYELFRAESDLLMVMEYVRGEALDRIAQRLVALPPEHAAYVIDKILSALEHAHRAGIVHCDMKPANVMVTIDGGVKIMDFGIARVRGDEHVTVDGQLMGTPAYMPPEQVLGQHVDARSDLYSVGIIFYRLLAGALPFKAENAIAMVQQQISAEPLPLHLHREGLPGWCGPILRRALAKAPADRFQSAEQFRDALAAATGVLKPEAARAFFSSNLDLELAAPPRPGDLERFGLTRVWTIGAPGMERPPSRAVSPPPDADPTLVLPRRRVAVAGSVLVMLAAAGAALLITGPWRSGAMPAVAPAGEPTDALVNAAHSPGPDRLEPGMANIPASAVLHDASPRPHPVPTAPAKGPTAATETAIDSPAANTASSAADADATATDAPGAVANPLPALAARTRPTTPAVKSRAVPYVLEALALVQESDKPRQRDSQVFLVDGRINVKATDDGSLLYTLPFNDVLSISYSRGRDPLWDGPGGPTPIARASGGLGIFRGTRHWVSVRIRNAAAEFLVLRLGSGARARDAIAVLEERTGRRAVMLSESPED